MRFASILLLLTSLVPLAAADDAKQLTKDSILTPEKQMEKAIAEYKKIVTDFYQWRRVVQAPAIARGILLPPNELHKAMDKKKTEVLSLHKRLGIIPDQNLYKKSKERRIELADQFEKVFQEKRDLELSQTDPVRLAKLEEPTKASEDLNIELTMASLLEQLNTPSRK